MYNFFRLIRTLSSEAYGILDKDEKVIGRFDLHYTNEGIVDAVVTVQKKMSKEEQLDLIQKIDIDLVENAELNDNNFNVTFFIAIDANTYGKDNG